jgi:hypothetical protein
VQKLNFQSPALYCIRVDVFGRVVTRFYTRIQSSVKGRGVGGCAPSASTLTTSFDPVGLSRDTGHCALLQIEVPQCLCWPFHCEPATEKYSYRIRMDPASMHA